MEKQIVPSLPVAVEISMYPLQRNYAAPILDFIRALRRHPDLVVHTNELSTQVSGDFAVVFPALQAAMAATFRADAAPTVSFVLKILNVEVTPGTTVDIENLPIDPSDL
jgi:uncharacterized protein YqgV (UPF0045/DUF77 family)